MEKNEEQFETWIATVDQDFQDLAAELRAIGRNPVQTEEARRRVVAFLLAWHIKQARASEILVNALK